MNIRYYIDAELKLPYIYKQNVTESDEEKQVPARLG